MAAKSTVTGLTGLWLLDQQIYDNSAERRNPPLTPEAKAIADAQRKARADGGDVIGDGGKSFASPAACRA